jgi:hypothetical protein
LQKTHAHTAGKHHFKTVSHPPRRFFVRAAWIIILGVICVFLFAGAYEYLGLTQRTSRLRQQLENDARQQLMILLPKIQDLALKGNWKEASRELSQWEPLLPNTSMYLIDRGGSILAQRDSTAAPDQEMLSGTFDSSQVSAYWLVKDQLLRASIPITGEGQEVLAYLIGVTDLGTHFRALYHEQVRHIAYLMLVILVLLGASDGIFAAVCQAYPKPLPDGAGCAVRKTARTISRSSGAGTVPNQAGLPGHAQPPGRSAGFTGAAKPRVGSHG